MKLTIARKVFLLSLSFTAFVVGLSLSFMKTEFVLLFALACLSVGSLLSYLLSANLVQGIRVLTDATRQLANGKFNRQLDWKRTDELGELATALNNLAGSLDKQDRAHRQFVADTSHELRTPVAILRAQVEAMQDGVQSLDGCNLSVLHSEIMALSKLIDDLHWLARFDVGQVTPALMPVEIISTLEDVLEAFEERFREKKISVDKHDLEGKKCLVNADSDRIRRVFANLLANSLRYTDEGGTLKVSMATLETHVQICFEDSEPGVPEEMLPRIFDRFFRVEQSRSRTLGGSGLGLSICKNIVDLHHGEIAAEHSPVGGLRVRIRLPLKGNGGDV